MYFFDPYFDGKIKLLTNKNGVLGFERNNFNFSSMKLHLQKTR